MGGGGNKTVGGGLREESRAKFAKFAWRMMISIIASEEGSSDSICRFFV